MKRLERIDMRPEELDALVERVKSGSLQEGDSQIVETMVETLKFLSSAIDEKNMSIKRLRRILNIGDSHEVLLVIALGVPAEEARLDPLEPGGDIRYWRDQDSIHHVPKRGLDEIIVNVW